MTSNLGRTFLPAGMVVVVLCSACGPRRAAPVDPERARQALHTALDAWKAGKKPDELPGSTPAITVQDFDWMQGRKLVAYQLVDEGKPEDANLRIQVRLTVQQGEGKPSHKTVTYIVGTDPVLTVFRALE